MQHYKTKFIQVWQEQLTAEEKRQLLSTFLADEAEWKALLENEYEQAIRHRTQHLPGHRAAAILGQLHAQLLLTPAADEETGAVPVVRMPDRRRWFAAAAVATLAASALFLFRPAATGPGGRAAVAATGSRLHTVVNATTTDSLVRLEDGSLVTLGAGSSIRYYEPYINDRRDISLAGRARFKVAKDTARPFTVSAGGIATTALGTEFLVTTQQQNKVAVRLFEGRVAIHQAAGGPAMKEVLLRPGEEFSLDQGLHQYTVKQFTPPGDPVSDPVVAEKKPHPERTPVPALEFSQEPLSLVLTAIGKRYHVRFTYDEDALHYEQVTGKFLASDSLSTVLSILGTVNRLTFTPQGGAIAVIKTEQ